MLSSYTGSASPYGTFDQGGNVFEWSETIINEGSVSEGRGLHGGAFFTSRFDLDAASSRYSSPPIYEFGYVGFRLVMVPEPSTGLLVIAGLLGLAGWRRVRA